MSSDHDTYIDRPPLTDRMDVRREPTKQAVEEVERKNGQEVDDLSDMKMSRAILWKLDTRSVALKYTTIRRCTC